MLLGISAAIFGYDRSRDKFATAAAVGGERVIAIRYVTGHRSFFVHPAADRGPAKVSGRTRADGEWEVKTTDELVGTIRRAVGDV